VCPGNAVAAAPWNPAHYLARVGLQARQVEAGARPAANLVFSIEQTLRTPVQALDADFRFAERESSPPTETEHQGSRLG
jgi:hypothetical protein